MFDNYTYLLLLDLSHFDSSEIYINQFMFNDCLNVKFINLTNSRYKQVNTFINVFGNCTSLTSIDLTNSKLAGNSYKQTFLNCKSLISLDLSQRKHTRFKATKEMFRNSNNLILLDISNFDTISVTQATQKGDEFTGCNKLKYLNLRNYKGIDIFDLNS